MKKIKQKQNDKLKTKLDSILMERFCQTHGGNVL